MSRDTKTTTTATTATTTKKKHDLRSHNSYNLLKLEKGLGKGIYIYIEQTVKQARKHAEWDKMHLEQ